MPHCPGHWAVQLLQCTATPPRGRGQCDSCIALPHCIGAVGSGTHATHYHTAWGRRAVELLQRTALLPGGSGQCNSCNALPHCLGAVGSGTPAMELPQFTATLPVGSGQCNSCNALPYRMGAVGRATAVMLRLTSLGDGESCQGGGRCLKSATLAMYCHTTWGQ